MQEICCKTFVGGHLIPALPGHPSQITYYRHLLSISWCLSIGQNAPMTISNLGASVFTASHITARARISEPSTPLKATLFTESRCKLLKHTHLTQQLSQKKSQRPSLKETAFITAGDLGRNIMPQQWQIHRPVTQPRVHGIVFSLIDSATFQIAHNHCLT